MLKAGFVKSLLSVLVSLTKASQADLSDPTSGSVGKAASKNLEHTKQLGERAENIRQQPQLAQKDLEE